MQPDFRILFESAPNPYVVLTIDLNIAAVSNAYLDLVNAEREKLIGKHFSELLTENIYGGHSNATVILDMVHQVLQNKKGETLAISDEKGNRICDIYCLPVMNKNNEVNYIINRIDDVSEIAALNKTVQQLKDSDKVKDEFLSNVSHDLRAPLHVISGYAQILLNDYADKFDEEGIKNLEHIKTQTGSMGDLISGLFSYSRTINKTPALQPVNMRDIVLDALAAVKDRYSSFAANVNIGSLPNCTCDPELLQLVWSHLIGNAVKYSAGKDKPVIEIGSTNTERELTYYVKDNGAGFDMDYVHKLFQPFERLHHASDFAGPGLGLALARNVIEKHGGKIWAQSKENEGTSIYFTLPKTE